MLLQGRRAAATSSSWGCSHSNGGRRGKRDEKTKQTMNPRKKFCQWKFQRCCCTSIPAGRQLALGPAAARRGGNLCQKVCFPPQPHLHIWIIHAAYKHIKWRVAARHLKAEIRPCQLIIKMSNVSGWTHGPRVAPFSLVIICTNYR